MLFETVIQVNRDMTASDLKIQMELDARRRAQRGCKGDFRWQTTNGSSVPDALQNNPKRGRSALSTSWA